MAAMKTFLLIFMSLVAISSAQLCGSTTRLTAGQSLNINWPGSNTQSSCVFVITAPTDYYLKATFTINMRGTPPNCNTDYLAVSPDNMANWAGASYFCGAKSGLVIKSIGNELKIGVTATTLAQSVQVVVQVVKSANGDCQCG
jgi:hypothetical protein